MSNKPYQLSVKAIITNPGGEFLILKRSSTSKANAGKWEFPGGKLDSGERFEEALKREVAEETGLEIDLMGVAGAGESETPDKRIAYIFIKATVSGGVLEISDEHEDYRWAASSELHKIDFAPQYMDIVRSLL